MLYFYLERIIVSQAQEQDEDEPWDEIVRLRDTLRKNLLIVRFMDKLLNQVQALGTNGLGMCIKTINANVCIRYLDRIRIAGVGDYQCT